MSSIDWHPLWLSLQVGVAATAIALVAGSALGFWLSRRGGTTGKLLDSTVMLPLVLPPTVLGYYLLVLIGRRSPVGKIWESIFGEPLVFTLKAAIIAASVVTIPLVARSLQGAFLQIDKEMEEAALLDGATGWQLFRHLYLPLIEAPLVAAAAIAFARTIGDFGATLMVAGNIEGKTQTAAIAIYDLIIAGKDQQALVMVILISIISLGVLIITSGRRDRP